MTAYRLEDYQSERFMKLLGDTMAVLSDARKRNWDEFRDSIAFTYVEPFIPLPVHSFLFEPPTGT